MANSRRARRQLGWSLEHLADTAGVSIKAVASLEGGKHLARRETIAKIDGADFETEELCVKLRLIRLAAGAYDGQLNGGK